MVATGVRAGWRDAGTNLMTRCDRIYLFIFIIYSFIIDARRVHGAFYNNSNSRPIVGLIDGQFCDNLTVSMNSSAFPHNLDPAHLLAASVVLRDGAKYPFWIHCYLNTSSALSISTSTSSIGTSVVDNGSSSMGTNTYSFSNLTSSDLADAANSQQTNITLHHPDLTIRDDRYQYLVQVAQKCEPHLLQRCQSFRLGLLNQESSKCPTCGSADSNCDNVHHCTSDCGQIKSVNYPFNYGNNHRCRWSIKAPHTYYVNLSIIDFDIPSSNKTELGTCIFDYLTLIDGYTGKRLGCYCNENLPPPFIVSPWNELIIQFDTNSETTGRGFYFQYEFMKIELSPSIKKQLRPTINSEITTNDTALPMACLSGWQYFRGSCYRAFNELEPLQWYDAENKCNAHGKGLDGHLVSILDKDEMLVIHYLMTNVWRSARYRDYYIGLIDVSREGVYRWSDNNPMSYTDWELKPMLLEEETTPAQPDGGAYEDCTIIKYSSFSRTSNWHDVPCSLGKHYHSNILERQAANQGLRDYVNSYICKSDSISLGSKVRMPLFSNEFMPVLVHIEHLSKHLTPPTNNNRLIGTIGGNNKVFGINNPINGSGILGMLDDNRYFVCDNSEVISVVLRCDGVPHCRDGSDESNGCDQYCLDWQFKCANGRCISVGAYCNFVDDCGDGSDESRCERHRCKLNEFKCQNGQCIMAQQRCDLLPDCSDSSDEGKLCTFGSNCNSASTFQCYNGNCIPQYAVCDFQIDCPGKFHEDEDALTCELILRSRSLDFKLYASTTNYANNASPVAYYPQANQELANGWSRQNLFKCTSGNMIDRSLKCLYEFDKYGYQIGCRDVTHLIDCASFECPRDYVKCSNSYCIPWRYICDGKWDCIMGDDEVGCARYVCPGQYKCANQSSCILLHQLCDGHRQCPMGDDEWFCDLQCPSQCDCIGQSVQCMGRNLTSLPSNYISKLVRKLDLSHNSLGPNLSTCDFSAYHHLGELILHHNGIRVLIPRKFHQLRNLYKLDLSNNQIHSVKRGAFAGLRRVTQLLLESNPELDTLEPEAFLGLSSLQMLNISSSRIQALRKNTFDGLTSLRHLLLRNNMIVEIEDGALRTLSSLVSLDMRGNEIRSFTKSVFTDLKSLRNLSTDSFKFCCLVSHQIPSDRCLPLPDEISDCEDLLSSVPQSTCIWIAGIVAFVGNSIVIVWRYRDVKNLKADQPANKREVGQVNSTLLLSLGCADLLMGIYLLLIAIVDSWYRGRYIENSDNWRESFLCKLCGFLSTVSIEVSVFTLVFIAYNRWTEICLEKPDHRFKLTPFCYLRLVIFSWILALTIATLPLAIEPYFKGQFYARSGVCLAFHITNQKAAGWLYSIIVFQGFYLLAFCIIVTCYRLMYIKITEEARKFGTEQPNHQVKIVLILITSFAAWSPTIILRLMSFAGIALPAAVYSWIAVLVLPVNSAINPMIYTIPSIRHQIRLLIRNYRARKSAHHHGVATAAAVAAAVAAQQQQGTNGGLQQQPSKKEALPLLEVSHRRPLDQRNVPPGYLPIKQYLSSRQTTQIKAENLVALALEIVRDIEAKQTEGRLYKSLNLDSVFVSDQFQSKIKNLPLSLFLADHEDYEPLRKCYSHHQVTGRHAHCECANVHRFGDLLNELIEHYKRRKHQDDSLTLSLPLSLANKSPCRD